MSSMFFLRQKQDRDSCHLHLKCGHSERTGVISAYTSDKSKKSVCFKQDASGNIMCPSMSTLPNKSVKLLYQNHQTSVMEPPKLFFPFNRKINFVSLGGNSTSACSPSSQDVCIYSKVFKLFQILL